MINYNNMILIDKYCLCIKTAGADKAAEYSADAAWLDTEALIFSPPARARGTR